METTLHFGLGKNIGVILAQIAREKILYDFNIDAACNVFMESLGCDRKIALDLISGKDFCLYVNDEDGQLYMCSRDELPEEEEYPVFDFKKVSDWWLKRIIREGDGIVKDMSSALSLFYCPSKKVPVSFYTEVRIDNIINAYVNNNPDGLKDELYTKMMKYIDGSDLQGDKSFIKMRRLVSLLKIAIEYGKDASNKIKIIKECKAAGIIDDTQYIQEYLDLAPMTVSEVHTMVTETIFRMENPASNDEYSSLLEEYMKADKEIREQLRYHILPVDITKNFDAGWLAPSGDFFGLNGTKANMLHIQIADKLYDQGYIPHDDEVAQLTQKDTWLEKHGWIRVHGAEIAFWPAKEYNIAVPTKLQIEKLIEYAQECHNGSLVNISNHREVLKASHLKQADDIQIKKLFDPYF